MPFLRRALAFLIILVVAAVLTPAVGTPTPSVERGQGGEGYRAATTSDLLPAADAVSGWQMREAARAYNPQNLYEYIDGNADLFLSYGFVDVAVGDYAPTSGEGWISVDVYKMGAPLNAFGIFGSEKAEGVKALPLGTQGYQSAGLIAFWKGQYYVKVSLVEGSDSAAAQKMAEVAAGRIIAEATMPAELARLPVERRIAGSERYAKKDALGHKLLVEVVSASYSAEESRSRGVEEPKNTEVGDVKMTLYIADLGSPEKAAEGLAKLRRFEASTGATVADLAGVGEGCFAVRDPYYGEMVVARERRFVVIGVSEEAKREAVTELVKAGVASASAVGAQSAAADAPTSTPR